MARRVVVLGGVAVRRAVTTSDVPADQALAKVKPVTADLEAVFAAGRRWRDVSNLGDVFACLRLHTRFNRRRLRLGFRAVSWREK